MPSVIERENRVSAYNYHPLPVVLVRGSGCHVWDESGTKYIDMMSAYSAVSHGHCHPKLVRALKNQAARLCVTSRAFHTDRLAPFMEKLCAISGMDMGLPMNTGAEAVETAIKAARLWGYRAKKIPHDKAHIIVADHNFHGRTTTIVGFSSEAEYKRDFGPYATGAFSSVPFGDAIALEAAITPHTAAFIVEPIQGEGGIILPPSGWLAEAQSICRKHNVLFILDEIQTGLGRTGKMFAYQHEISAPDGLIVGKALGGGILPVSAFLARRDVMELFTPGSHGSTFGGNALAATVGLCALKLLEKEKLVENSARLGEYLLTSLQNFSHPAIRAVRGRGLWVGIDIDPKVASARKICEHLMGHGVLTKETHHTVIRLAPPLVIKKKTLDKAIALVKHAIEACS